MPSKANLESTPEDTVYGKHTWKVHTWRVHTWRHCVYGKHTWRVHTWRAPLKTLCPWKAHLEGTTREHTWRVLSVMLLIKAERPSSKTTVHALGCAFCTRKHQTRLRLCLFYQRTLNTPQAVLYSMFLKEISQFGCEIIKKLT
jgi:hypothetical protein